MQCQNMFWTQSKSYEQFLINVAVASKGLP